MADTARGNASPQGSKRELRKEQLLDVATHLFSRYGLEGTTTKDIAREAGVSPGLLYHYYSSKEELLVDVVVRFGEMSKLDYDGVRQMITLPVETGLVTILEKMAEVVKENREAIWLVIRAAARFPAVDAALRKFKSRGITLLAEYFQAKIDSGELLPFDVKRAAICLVHCLTMECIMSTEESYDVTALGNGFLYGLVPRADRACPGFSV